MRCSIPLTGLLNRKALGARFEEIAQQASVAGGSVCLLACDLDHFKQVNDVHGHETGDRVLKETAYVMRKHLRSFELVYRMGGEEFLIVLPGASVEQGSRDRRARPGGGRGRAALRARRHRVGGRRRGERARASCSSRSSAPPTRCSTTAKRSGRNRVVAERHARRCVASPG